MITDAVAFIRRLDRKPWLLVGKGPTLNRYREVRWQDYHLLTLNHACNVVPPTLAHFTDLDAWSDCCEKLIRDYRAVCLPWHPHVKFQPTTKTLAELSEEDARLMTFESRSDLYSYNSTRAAKLSKRAGFATIPVRYFSAVAGFNLLVAAGVTNVHSIGVDGGTQYARYFTDKDRLANGRASFDDQYRAIDLTCHQLNVQHTPLFRVG